MKYTKIHPFDFYKLPSDKLATVETSTFLEKIDRERKHWANSVKETGEVKISLSGPGISEPYSFTAPLIEFDGVTYLRTTTIPPSDAALDMFDQPNKDQIRAIQAESAKRGEVFIKYEPESDDVTPANGVSAVFKFDGKEILKQIPPGTEFYEAYQYEPLNIEIDHDKKELTLLESPIARPFRFKLTEIDSQGRCVYLPAN